MAYMVKELAKLSGVSVRTLHWYDEVGLLKPFTKGANNYRYYEEEQLIAYFGAVNTGFGEAAHIR